MNNVFLSGMGDNVNANATARAVPFVMVTSLVQILLKLVVLAIGLDMTCLYHVYVQPVHQFYYSSLHN
jgi:hypothetical protein